MVVNRAESTKGETVQDWVDGYKILGMKHEIRNKSQIQNSKAQNSFGLRTSDFGFVARSGIVHRLDKETSGVLLIAKTEEAFGKLQGQFKEREVGKTYMALVHGRVEPPGGVIRAPVGRLPWHRERFGILAGGREAETEYKVLSIMYYELGGKKEELSLINLYPKTGRTHQIRVHLKSIGHPIVGDLLYAGRKTARKDRKWCPRLFLHASKIGFTHPTAGRRMIIEAALPVELARVLESLSGLAS